MKVLITGESGLSNKLCTYLKEKEIQAECMTIRGGAWREKRFEGFNCVVHVAGLIPKKGVQKEEYYKVNRDLTLEFAQKMKASNVGLFVYISSMAVYHIPATIDSKKGLVSRETVCNPQSDYGRSKLEAEQGLRALENGSFKVAIIRAPSIYSEENTSYFSQYALLIRKFKAIPVAFTDCCRSSIYADNLCELIRLIVSSNSSGYFFPDDGEINAVEYCSMIAPTRKKMKLLGMAVSVFLRKNPIITGIYGQVAYDRSLTEAFAGKYRIVSRKQIAERLKDVGFNT